MIAETEGLAPDELQFDRAVPLAPSAERTACAACGARLTTEYHTVDSAPVCAACRALAERAAAPVREWRTVLAAAVAGLGAAVLGAAIYYGVIALFRLEIGLVAILTGFMVGTAVRWGAKGRGGRRLQVLAAALTYVSVAMAYLPLALRGAEGQAGIVALVLLTFALPVLVVVGSLPSGLLSALIIGFGMVQAWKMTGAPAPVVQGPFRLGAPEPEPDPESAAA